MAPDVQRQIEETATKSFLDKDSLHQATAVGYGGAPQMRRWERSQFLGQFPEHVLWAVAAPVLTTRPLPAAVLQALEDPRCERVVIKASLVGSTRPVLEAAKQHGLPVTVVHSPEYKNDIGLVITTAEPHNQDNIFIEEVAS